MLLLDEMEYIRKPIIACNECIICHEVARVCERQEFRFMDSSVVHDEILREWKVGWECEVIEYIDR
jgi:hypothetical protein